MEREKKFLLYLFWWQNDTDTQTNRGRVWGKLMRNCCGGSFFFTSASSASFSFIFVENALVPPPKVCFLSALRALLFKEHRLNHDNTIYDPNNAATISKDAHTHTHTHTHVYCVYACIMTTKHKSSDSVCKSAIWPTVMNGMKWCGCCGGAGDDACQNKNQMYTHTCAKKKYYICMLCNQLQSPLQFLRLVPGTHRLINICRLLFDFVLGFFFVFVYFFAWLLPCDWNWFLRIHNSIASRKLRLDLSTTKNWEEKVLI